LVAKTQAATLAGRHICNQYADARNNRERTHKAEILGRQDLVSLAGPSDVDETYTRGDDRATAQLIQV
jgi:hypothetical protein